LTAVDYLIVAAAAVAASWTRMGIALLFSIIFSLIVGTAAGTNRFFERLAIPVLDILQSIPILGFFPLALQFFYFLSPAVGSEVAAIFLIFTSQVWNITFVVYESTRTIKTELLDTARFLGMSTLDRFRYLYIPASLPRVLHTIQPSWANGIFFLVGSEILSFGETEIELFGLGTLISRFTAAGDTVGVIVTLAMLVLATVLTTFFVFIPLTHLTEPRRRHGGEVSGLRLAFRRLMGVARTIPVHPGHAFSEYNKAVAGLVRHVAFISSILRGVLFFVLGGFLITLFIARGEELLARVAAIAETINAIGLNTLAQSSLYSLARVGAAVVFSVAWSLPAAIAVARRPKATAAVTTVLQVVASIPVTILYPLFASLLAEQDELRAFIMIISATQWYVFFQVLSGLRNIPAVELEVADLLALNTMDKIKTVYLPRAMPALVTGCITAAGGAWNGLVVAERFVLGDFVAETRLPGLGKLLSIMTYGGNLVGSIAVITIMSTLIVLMNRLFWKRMYDSVISKLKIQEQVGR